METQTENGKNIVGSEVITRTYCELGENGFWHVTQTVIQKRKIENETEWEEKTLQMSAHAENLETAILNAFVSIEAYLATRSNDLFATAKPLLLPDKLDDGEFIN